MTRQLRIVMPGGVYHLISRGDERNNIFRDEEDRKTLLGFLDTACREYECNLYVYTYQVKA
jgi:putative transposase